MGDRAKAWLRSIKAKFTATPGTGVVGIDQAAIIRRTAQSIWDQSLAGADRMREQEAQWKYAERESITALVRRVSANKESVRPRFKATTVTEVGGPGHGVVWAESWTIEDLDAELRFALAQHYAAKNLTKDYDEARERASRVEIHLDRSFALGSAGFL